MMNHKQLLVDGTLGKTGFAKNQSMNVVIEDCVAVTRSSRTVPGRWSSDDAEGKAKPNGTSRHKQMTTMPNRLSEAILPMTVSRSAAGQGSRTHEASYSTAATHERSGHSAGTKPLTKPPPPSCIVKIVK